MELDYRCPEGGLQSGMGIWMEPRVKVFNWY